MKPSPSGSPGRVGELTLTPVKRHQYPYPLRLEFRSNVPTPEVTKIKISKFQEKRHVFEHVLGVQTEFKNCCLVVVVAVVVVVIAPNVWLHGSVGRALHRYRRGHGFESRWRPDFFLASSFQLLKLENLLRWSLFTFFG